MVKVPLSTALSVSPDTYPIALIVSVEETVIAPLYVRVVPVGVPPVSAGVVPSVV
jgi:hypothetical protein